MRLKQVLRHSISELRNQLSVKSKEFLSQGLRFTGLAIVGESQNSEVFGYL